MEKRAERKRRGQFKVGTGDPVEGFERNPSSGNHTGVTALSFCAERNLERVPGEKDREGGGRKRKNEKGRERERRGRRKRKKERRRMEVRKEGRNDSRFPLYLKTHEGKKSKRKERRERPQRMNN